MVLIEPADFTVLAVPAPLRGAGPRHLPARRIPRYRPIPSSNRPDGMRLVLFHPRIAYRWNRIERAAELSSKQGSAMMLEKLQSPARSDKLVLARSRTIETILSSPPARRGYLAASVLALSVSLLMFASPGYAQTMTAPAARQAAEDRLIRPFTVHVPQAALNDLRRRIAATRWPDKETVADQSQGAQLAKLQELVRYWGTGYDWRKAEAKLNALPQFMTPIDGVDIHFIHG